MLSNGRRVGVASMSQDATQTRLSHLITSHLTPHTFHMACQAWPAPAQVNTQMLQNMTGVVAMDRWMAAGDSWKCRANGNHFPSPLFRYSVPGLPAYQACIWILGS